MIEIAPINKGLSQAPSIASPKLENSDWLRESALGLASLTGLSDLHDAYGAAREGEGTQALYSSLLGVGKLAVTAATVFGVYHFFNPAQEIAPPIADSMPSEVLEELLEQTSPTLSAVQHSAPSVVLEPEGGGKIDSLRRVLTWRGKGESFLEALDTRYPICPLEDFYPVDDSLDMILPWHIAKSIVALPLGAVQSSAEYIASRGVSGLAWDVNCVAKASTLMLLIAGKATGQF